MQFPFEGPSADRLAAAEFAPAMARFAAGDLIERGCVVLISLDAIRERTGRRWPMWRDEVWALLAEKAEDCLSGGDLRQQINETDLLIGMPREDAIGVQAVALRILEEVVAHFLGVAEPVDLKVCVVDAIEGMMVSTTDLDPLRIPTAWRSASSVNELRPPVDFHAERERNPVLAPTTGDERLRVRFALEAVTSLRHDKVAALRVQPMISYAGSGAAVSASHLGMLGDNEIAAIDAAALAFAALFLPTEGDGRPPLIVPASFRTLGGRRGRRLLTDLPDASPEQIKHGLFIELLEVDRGTPPGRLAEVASLVGALCRGVFARMPLTKRAAEPMREARLHGLSLDMSDLASSDSDLAHELLASAAQARTVAPAVLALGLPSRDFFPIAEVAGCTHAATRALGALHHARPAAAA
ncbi:hypothetical protein [Phenylobacterium sp.]|uniref:hypothetical protein n=1 Tax=Phenylobacterium sp. TaxID=1871053 RepID=UPI0035B2BD5E